jgi:hypothetical protein
LSSVSRYRGLFETARNGILLLAPEKLTAAMEAPVRRYQPVTEYGFPLPTRREEIAPSVFGKVTWGR